MYDLIGKRVKDVVEILADDGREVRIIESNDRKMKNFDEKIVVRLREDGNVVTITSTNFLFRPLEEK